MLRTLLRAIWTGCLGMLIAMVLAGVVVIGAMIFDPRCGAGDSGGCAMGLVTAPMAAALPGFGLGVAYHLSRARALAQAPRLADDPAIA